MENGEDRSERAELPEALADMMREIDSANRLAARAARG